MPIYVTIIHSIRVSVNLLAKFKYWFEVSDTCPSDIRNLTFMGNRYRYERVGRLGNKNILVVCKGIYPLILRLVLE